MFNKVILIGRLTRDVELRYTPGGTAVAKFGLASSRKYKDNVTGENKEEVLFVDITVFGRSAEIANQYLGKGRQVLIEGRLVLDQWVDSSGQKRSKHSVVAEKVQFMGSKNDNQLAPGQTQNYQTQPAYSSQLADTTQSYKQPVDNQPSPQPQNVPEIDIDDDNIPF